MSDEIQPVVTVHLPNTEPPPAGNLQGSADATIDETFTNFSTTTFSRDYWGYDYQKGFSGPSITPGPVLDTSTNDVQEFDQSQMLSWIDQGPISVFCCWLNPKTGVRFGVRLRATYQMFEIGPRPVWDVMQDTNPPGSEPTWVASGVFGAGGSARSSALGARADAHA